MTNTTWTNTGENILPEKKSNRLKFVFGGLVLLAAIIFLVVNAMSGNTQLYKTVDEFYADQSRLVGRDLRVSGFVLGDTIEFTQINATTSRLEFDIVDDVNNPGQRLHIVSMNEPKPDLLQHEAQALVEGRADENGVFMANPGGLLLKCPTRYEELEPGEYSQ
ncbi:MAG TPA: cytochrome c maturation protein CcmE [Anaerolineae bacterium]|nr:cytochrome c maturation protein CcmE [Anaerolineae bacterium]HIP71245.1 cytochrome c maturation protein CcmE [Anaerolineae bacterium]